MSESVAERLMRELLENIAQSLEHVSDEGLTKRQAETIAYNVRQLLEGIPS